MIYFGTEQVLERFRAAPDGAGGGRVFAEDLKSGVAPEERELKRVKKGFKRKEVEKGLARGGKLSFGEVLRCKVRYLSDGMTFGSRGFVEKVFKGSRERFGQKRKTGVRPLRGVGWQKKQTRLYSMRQLMKDCLG